MRRGGPKSARELAVKDGSHSTASATNPINIITPEVNLGENSIIVGPDALVAGVTHNAESRTAVDVGDEKAVVANGDAADRPLTDEVSPSDTAGKLVGGELEKAADDEEEAEDMSRYPKGWALAALTFGLSMAIFVVALDNTIIGMRLPRSCEDSLKLKLKLNARSNCNSQDHDSFRLFERCWLVWIFISAHDHSIAAILWKDLHEFQCQVDLPECAGDLRT